MTEKQKRKNIFTNPRFKYGSLATGLTAVFIAVIVIINIIASVITNRFPSVDLDLTANNLNSLTEESIKIAQSINIETEFIMLASKKDFEHDAYYKRVDALVQKYIEVNPKIKVSYVDIVRNPGYASEYPNDSLDYMDIIVKSPVRYRHLNQDKLFLQDENEDIISVAELSLTSSLLAVSTEELPVIYLTNANNEQSVPDFNDLLISNGFELKEFNLLTDTPQTNANLMILNGVSTDLTDKQIANLEAYLYNNGSYGKSILVTLFAGQSSLPKLEAFLKKWGITVSNDVVFEDDPLYFDMEPYELFPVAGVSHIMDAYRSASTPRILLPMSRTMTLEPTAEAVVESLLVTSEKSFIFPSNEKEGWEPSESDRGSHVVAAVSTKTSENQQKSSVLVLGSMYAIAPQMIGTSGLSNAGLAVTLVREGSGNVDEDIEVDVPWVQLAYRDISLDSNTKNFWGIWVFSITLPALVFIAGIWVFFRRRRL